MPLLATHAARQRRLAATLLVTTAWLSSVSACGPATLSTKGDAGANDDPFCDAPPKCAQEVTTDQERADCRALLAGPCATEARVNLQCLRDNELCSTTGRSDLTLAIETCKAQAKAQRDCTNAAPPVTDAGRDAD